MIRVVSFAAIAALALAAPAQAGKQFAVSFPVEFVGAPAADKSFNLHQVKWDKVPPANVVLHQEGRPLSAAKLAAAVTIDTETADRITLPAGSALLGARTSLGDVYCRVAVQTGKKKRYKHAGLCFLDSGKKGVFDEVLQAREDQLWSVYDIKAVDRPGRITPVAYAQLTGDARPRSDLVIRLRIGYTAALLGASGRPTVLAFYTALATPPDFMTENWGSRNWPFVQFDLKADERVAPETKTVNVSDPPIPLAVGPFKINAQVEGETLNFTIDGNAAGRYDLGGDYDMINYYGADRRRVFRAVPLAGGGS